MIMIGVQRYLKDSRMFCYIKLDIHFRRQLITLEEDNVRPTQLTKYSHQVSGRTFSKIPYLNSRANFTYHQQEFVRSTGISHRVDTRCGRSTCIRIPAPPLRQCTSQTRTKITSLDGATRRGPSASGVPRGTAAFLLLTALRLQVAFFS